MRNGEFKSVVEEIISYIKDLPYFSKQNIEALGIKNYYLKIVLSRLEKSGKVTKK